jgi:GH18 family chitinase
VKTTSVADPTKSASATVTLSPPVTISLTPLSATLAAAQTQQYAATVGGTSNGAINWTLSPTVGTISAAGLYTAPASITSSQTVTVKATSVADPTKSASATVTLNPPMNVTVAPASVTLTQSQTQTFSATVTNTGNTAVTWSLSPVVGSITAAGLYTAPASITSSQTVTVKATSVADPTKSATAAVTLTPPVTVSLTPSSVSLLPSQNQTFTATVSGTSNTGVTWSFSSALGGLVSGATTAVYVAPSTAPTTQAVTITATSVANPSKTATAVITLLQAVTVSLSPSTVTLAPSGTQQFTPAVLGASNTAVTWSINPSVGAISSAGLYTAPSSILTAQTVTVTAQSVADSTKSASGVVSLQATPVVNQWSMGYYAAVGDPALPVAAIRWNGLTHVAHASANVNADGTLDLSIWQVSSTAVALVTAAHANSVKVLLTISQAGKTEIQQAVSSNLSALVTNIMTVVSTYGYDGMDIDWEPFVGSTNGSSMTALAQALRLALGSRLLTVDMEDPTWWAANQSNYSYFDRLSAMTYGMSGERPVNGPAWHNSALHCSGSDTYSCLDNMGTLWLNAGVSANKLNLGLPFYGDKWSGGVLASDPAQGISGPRQTWPTGHGPTWTESFNYNAIVPMITGQNYTWDPSAVVPYINHIGTTPSAYWYLTYDNPQSIQAKVQYIIAQNFGGWIIWHLGMDYMAGNPHPHPLLDAVQAGSAPAFLSASTLSSGTVGISHSASLSASGAAPLHWALSSGSLPNGLSLSSAGVISGTPTTTGTFTFIVTVGNFAGSASQSFAITIAASAN